MSTPAGCGAAGPSHVTVFRISRTELQGYRLEWKTNGEERFNVIEFATRQEAEEAAQCVAAVDPREPLEACRCALEYLAAGCTAAAMVVLEVLLKRSECQDKKTSTASVIQWFGLT